MSENANQSQRWFCENQWQERKREADTHMLAGEINRLPWWRRSAKTTGWGAVGTNGVLVDDATPVRNTR